MINFELFFYDKNLCDSIRDVVKLGPMTIEDAYKCLKNSENLKRDTEIAINLSKNGFPFIKILECIKGMQINKNKKIYSNANRCNKTN